MTKLKNRSTKFDKNRIDKLVEINRLIKIVDKSLRNEVGGFLTYYTEKIQDLSYVPTETDVRESIRLSEEEKVKKLLGDREQKIFWASLRYYMKTDKEFEKKAKKILSKLFVVSVKDGVKKE